MGLTLRTRLTVQPVGNEICLEVLTRSQWPLRGQCPEWSIKSLPDHGITVIGIVALATEFAYRFERFKIHSVPAAG